MPNIPRQFGRKRAQPRSQPVSVLRDTSAAYRRKRLSILTGEPLCRYCRSKDRITPATVLDHVVALALGGTDDPANLAPACRECNTDKAQAEAAFLRRGYDLAFVHLDTTLGQWIKIGLDRSHLEAKK